MKTTNESRPGVRCTKGGKVEERRGGERKEEDED
jgi:hypothetical protein